MGFFSTLCTAWYRLPNDFLCIFRSTHDGQLYLLLIEPEVNLSRAAQLCELAKDQIDDGPNPGVGILLDTTIGSFDVSNSHSSNQGPSLRHLHQCRLRTLAKRRHFHLADCTLNSQQQSIIREPGIIDRLGIDQKDTDDAAKFQKRVPLPPIACQSRCLHTKDSTHLPTAYRAQQAFKTGTRNSLSRDSEVFINHFDILPTQRTRTIHETILEPFAFLVVFHLIRRGLTDVHVGPPHQMVCGDFIARIIHCCRPRGFSWPAPASTVSAPDVVALAHSREVVPGPERREPLLRKVVVGIGPVGAAAL